MGHDQVAIVYAIHTSSYFYTLQYIVYLSLYGMYTRWTVKPGPSPERGKVGNMRKTSKL